MSASRYRRPFQPVARRSQLTPEEEEAREDCEDEWERENERIRHQLDRQLLLEIDSQDMHAVGARAFAVSQSGVQLGNLEFDRYVGRMIREHNKDPTAIFAAVQLYGESVAAAAVSSSRVTTEERAEHGDPNEQVS
ncbi:hypothetical protein JCM8547_004216 [Rhodosporidiobolus lusitaniae]